jgi:hypothetical protein
MESDVTPDGRRLSALAGTVQRPARPGDDLASDWFERQAAAAARHVEGLPPGLRERRPVADLRHRLEQAEAELLAVADLLAEGRAPDDELERDRCRLVAERVASRSRGAVDMLARPPRAGLDPRLAAGHDAGFIAERPAILRDAAFREQGEEP